MTCKYMYENPRDRHAKATHAATSEGAVITAQRTECKGRITT